MAAVNLFSVKYYRSNVTAKPAELPPIMYYCFRYFNYHNALYYLSILSYVNTINMTLAGVHSFVTLATSATCVLYIFISRLYKRIFVYLSVIQLTGDS